MNGPAPMKLRDARKWSLWLLVMCVVLYFFVNFQRSAVPGTIFNELQMDFQATAAAVAAMGAVFMYVYAFTQLVVGLLVDKYGGARTILVGCVLFCAGSVLFPMCSTLGMVYAGRVLIGMGAGVVYLALVKEIDRLFPDKFTLVLGLVILLGYSGSVFGGLPLSRMVGVIGWRWTFAAAGVLVVLSYAGYVYCYRRMVKPPIREERLSLSPLLFTLKTRTSRLVLVSAGCSFGIYYMMLTVTGKKFLEDFCQASPTVASGCLSLMVIVSAGGNFLSGMLSTWCGNRRRPFFLTALGACLLGSLLGLIGLRSGAGSWYFIGVMQLFALSAGFSPITNSLMREFNPSQYTGAAVCSLNFLAYISVAVCANLAGLFMDWFSTGNIVTETSVIYPRSSYVSVFVLALVISLVSMAAGVLVPETRGKNLYGKVR